LIASIIMLLHNTLTLLYSYDLFLMYISMATKNMHSVENSIIGNIYDKARYLGIVGKGDGDR
jgi:hypothetical protein